MLIAAANLLERPNKPEGPLNQFLRFASVGAVATLVHYSVLIALVELAGAPKTLSTVIGYLCGMMTSYLLNRVFTFADAPTSFWRGLAKFALVNTIGLGLNTAIFAALVAAQLHYILAQAAATLIVLFWNFFAARTFVFR